MVKTTLQAQGILGPSDAAYRTFSPTVAAVAAVILAMFCAFVEYEVGVHTAAQVSQYYKWLIDVEVMIFVGFGFLMTFLRRYGFGAVGFNFFCSCLVMLEGVLVIGAVQQVLGKGHTSITLDLPLMIDATFCAGSAMIAYGAVLGKTTPTQLTWLMVGLVPFYALNQHLCFHTLKALDMGGSITIHAFGAYYGLAASMVVSNGRQAFGAYTSSNIKNSATYVSDIFSMIGTLFLWMYWPSFNGALASIAEHAEGQLDAATTLLVPQQYYCVVNTLLSLLGSCVSTFMMSSWLNEGKFDMMHVQNATLAGGVAMGSSAALRLSPGGAVAVGICAGMLSTTGFGRVSPFLESKIGLGDTCGVHNLHGMPGLLGGFIAGLAAFGQLRGATPHGNTQLGYQIAALVCTVVVAVGSGALVAAVATGRLGIHQYKQLKDKQAGDQFDDAAAIDGLALFEDATFWTGVEIETPYSGGAHADLTNYSRRNGSYHVKNSTAAGQSYCYSSQHGGSGRPRQDVSATSGAARSAAAQAAAHKDNGLYAQGVVDQ